MTPQGPKKKKRRRRMRMRVGGNKKMFSSLPPLVVKWDSDGFPGKMVSLMSVRRKIPGAAFTPRQADARQREERQTQENV